LLLSSLLLSSLLLCATVTSLEQRLSQRFLCAHFLIDRIHFLWPSMSDADKHIARFAERYEAICERHGPWRVTSQGKALLQDFMPHRIAELCDGNGTKHSAKKTQQSAAERPDMPPPPPMAAREPVHQLRQPTRLPSKHSVDAQQGARLHSALPLRRRVLVPVSGGVASTACLWWALQRPEFDVHVVHLVGVERANKHEQMVALVQMARYMRALDGRPLIARFQQPAEETGTDKTDACDVDNSLSRPASPERGECSLKTLAALQHERFNILPMPTQPYSLHESVLADGATQSSIGNSEPLKHHPLTYALMYRQVLRCACALQCDDIVWGMFDDARSIVDALQPLFASKLRQHQNWFPFATRHEAFDGFVALSERSDAVWAAYRSPTIDADSSAGNVSATSSEAQRRKLSSSKARKSSNTGRSSVRADETACVVVPQMCGAALMPDAAQYATTCAHARSKNHDQSDGSSDRLRMMRW